MAKAGRLHAIHHLQNEQNESAALLFPGSKVLWQWQTPRHKMFLTGYSKYILFSSCLLVYKVKKLSITGSGTAA